MMLPDDVKSGSICVFGSWLGRPMDNLHLAPPRASCEFRLDGTTLIAQYGGFTPTQDATRSQPAFSIT